MKVGELNFSSHLMSNVPYVPPVNSPKLSPLWSTSGARNVQTILRSKLAVAQVLLRPPTPDRSMITRTQKISWSSSLGHGAWGWQLQSINNMFCWKYSKKKKLSSTKDCNAKRRIIRRITAVFGLIRPLSDTCIYKCFQELTYNKSKFMSEILTWILQKYVMLKKW